MDETVAVNNYLLETLVEFTGSESDRKTKTEEVFTKICRTCLCETVDNNLESKWFLAIGSSIITVTIKEMIEALTEIKIDMHDKLPHHICPTCMQAVDAAYSFRLHSQEIDEVLKVLLPTEIDSIAGDLRGQLVPTSSEKEEDLRVNQELNDSSSQEIDDVSKSLLPREGDVNNTELDSTTGEFTAQLIPPNSEQTENSHANQKLNDSGSQEIYDVPKSFLSREVDVNNTELGELKAQLVPLNSEQTENCFVNEQLNDSGRMEIDDVAKSFFPREGNVNNTELDSTTGEFTAQLIPPNSEQTENSHANEKLNDSGSQEIHDVPKSFLSREVDVNNTELGELKAQLVPPNSEQTENCFVNEQLNDSGRMEIDDVAKSFFPREGNVNNTELDSTTGEFTAQLIPPNSEQTENSHANQKLNDSGSQEIHHVPKSFLSREVDVNNTELGELKAQLVPPNSEQTENCFVNEQLNDSGRQEIDDVAKSFFPREGNVNNTELDSTTGEFTAQLIPPNSEQTENSHANEKLNDSGSQENHDVPKSFLSREVDVNNTELGELKAQLVPPNSEQTENCFVNEQLNDSGKMESDDVPKSFLPREGNVNNTELDSTTGEFTAQLIPPNSEQTENCYVNEQLNDSGRQEIDDVAKSFFPREGNVNNTELDSTTGEFTAQLIPPNSEQTENSHANEKLNDSGSQENHDVPKSFLSREVDVNNTELGELKAQLVPPNSEQTENCYVNEQLNDSGRQEIDDVAKSFSPRKVDVNNTELIDSTTGEFTAQLVLNNSEPTEDLHVNHIFNDSGSHGIDVSKPSLPREGDVNNTKLESTTGEFTAQLVLTNSEPTEDLHVNQKLNDSGCQDIDDVFGSFFPREGPVINTEIDSTTGEFTAQLVPTDSEPTEDLRVNQKFYDSGFQEIDDILRSFFPREGPVTINAELDRTAREFTAQLVLTNSEPTEDLHVNQKLNDSGCQEIDDVFRSSFPREGPVINTEIDSTTGEFTAQLVPTDSEPTEDLRVNQKFNDSGFQEIDDILRSFFPREGPVINTEIDSTTGEFTAQLVPTDSEPTEDLRVNQKFNDSGCQEIDDVLRSFLPTESDVITIGDLTAKLVPTESEQTEVLQISQQINDCEVSFIVDCATAPTSVQSNQCNLTKPNYEHVAEQYSTPGKRKLFKCGICSKEYLFRNGLYNHMVVAHIEKREIKCTKCQRKFKNAENLEGHKKRFCVPPGTVKNKLKHGPAKITLYPKKDKDNMDEEITIEINNFSCSLCDEMFELEAEFLNHLPDHKIKKCPHCKKTFARVAYLESHIWSHGTERPFVCPLCSKGFTATRGLRIHIVAHVEREAYACSECAKTFFSERDCISHQKMHQENQQQHLDLPQPYPKDPFLCAKKLLIHSDDCDELIFEEQASHNPVNPTDFSTTSEWVSDYLENVDVPPSALENLLEEPIYQDTIWQPPAAYNITIQQEITADGEASFKVINEPTIQNEAAPPDRTEVEDDASEVFGAEAFGKFTCALANCKMEFKRHTEIIHHYTSKHCLGPPPIKCPVCSMVLSGKSEIQNHIKSHLKFEYKCPYCPKTYWEANDLNQHLLSHSGERPYKCPKCPKMFKRRPDAKVHLRTHRICKEYKCNVCYKEFFSTTGLLMHMKGHAIIKELQCRYCNKQFPTRNRLLNHRRNVCEKKCKAK